MASIKISELNEITELDSNDLLPVVDTVADETKKMTYNSLKTQLIGDNFAVLTGNVANTELTLVGKQLNYPTGFNQNNCVIIGSMKKNNGSTVWNNYYFTQVTGEGGTTENEEGLVTQLYENFIKLQTITNYVKNQINPDPKWGYSYRIVLMKLS